MTVLWCVLTTVSKCNILLIIFLSQVIEC